MTTWPPPEPERVLRDEPIDRGSPVAALALVVGAIALGFSYPWILLAVVALLVMIFLHELGHYLAATRGGMKVTEFFLGFGPRIFAFKRGETEYGLKAIPLGAYVKVIGMNSLDPGVDPAEEHRTYRHASYPRRLLMASAGSLMHFALAIVCLFISLWGYGEYQARSWTVDRVGVGTPAAGVDIRTGDRILAVDGVPTGSYADFRTQIRSHPDATIALDLERDGQKFTTAVRLASDCDGKVGYLGISSAPVPVSRGLGQSAVGAVTGLGRGVVDSTVGIATLFSPSGISRYVDNLANQPVEQTSNGPVCSAAAIGGRPSSIVGITQGVAAAAKYGLGDFLALFAGVNVAIGVFNLIPMLPFDGGHVAVATYERIREIRSKRRYHADVAKLLPYAYGTVMVLALLFLTSFYLDVTRGVN